ncbi:hypothetical protein NGA_0163401 [Nannochloropsis gaditana CCMP526]|uniref:uncharacterized protein n=1 Tax=Nannochloropsis gaditana (strain CCMP526) TaxID=1093141 RepID=UPI00029F5C13|nr:hypothetical protein NGA_0163401 [Nannochloropsis gaditana CCMP526]EKU21685.1 hypothetical protein NGA_0163401 [Nannochloropsis gaditana CCMP526]|eukprot:XP_005854678.1 hypothetical protein NGA_0163401 [Nannochloropsis gaditana CCMP526]
MALWVTTQSKVRWSAQERYLSSLPSSRRSPSLLIFLSTGSCIIVIRCLICPQEEAEYESRCTLFISSLPHSMSLSGLLPPSSQLLVFTTNPSRSSTTKTKLLTSFAMTLVRTFSARINFWSTWMLQII